MTAKKQKAELIVYGFATFLTIAGTALCLAGLLVPHWYEVATKQGIVITKKARLGLWQDEICLGTRECETFWLSDSDYSRDPDFVMPQWKLIQGFETAATALAFFALLALVPIWATQFMHSSEFYRRLTFIIFYVPSMVAGFLAVIGCLVIASKGNQDNVDYAPFLSGIGGAVLFISACFSCVVCRYDPSYGTLENPVSPTYISP